jgi:hypothetical protein
MFVVSFISDVMGKIIQKEVVINQLLIRCDCCKNYIEVYWDEYPEEGFASYICNDCGPIGHLSPCNSNESD